MIFQLTHLIGGFQITVGVPSVDDDEFGVVGDFVFVARDAAAVVAVVARSLVMRESWMNEVGRSDSCRCRNLCDHIGKVIRGRPRLLQPGCAAQEARS